MTGTGFCSDTFGSAWMLLLEHLLRQKPNSAPRGYQTRELVNVFFNVRNLRANVLQSEVRNVNYRFYVAEWLWIWFGIDKVEPLARYIKRMRDFSDDGKTLAGAYGPRLAPQWDYIIEKLKGDRDTRQAVMSIWTPAPGPSKDIPCTLTLQFLIRENKLNLIVNMRSSDVWLGLPYDFFSFSQLANIVSAVLGIDTGEIIFNLASSHLYERDADKAIAVAVYSQNYTLTSPKLNIAPPTSLGCSILDGCDRDDSCNLEYPWNRYNDVLFKSANNESAFLLFPTEERDE